MNSRSQKTSSGNLVTAKFKSSADAVIENQENHKQLEELFLFYLTWTDDLPVFSLRRTLQFYMNTIHEQLNKEC